MIYRKDMVSLKALKTAGRRARNNEEGRILCGMRQYSAKSTYGLDTLALPKRTSWALKVIAGKPSSQPMFKSVFFNLFDCGD
jgi:hypothetical protein